MPSNRSRLGGNWGPGGGRDRRWTRGASFCLAGKRRLDEAIQMLRRAISIAERAGVRNAYTLPMLPWLATLLRERALQLPDHTPTRRKQLLREARRAVRKAIAASWLCKSD